VKRRVRSSVFQFKKAARRARDLKVRLILIRKRLIRKRLQSKKQLLRQLRHEKMEFKAKEGNKDTEYKKRIKSLQQEIFQLNHDARAVEEKAKVISDDRQAMQLAMEAKIGALPDFVIIGGKKCGTTFLYDLLTRHPYVEPAAKKELHYFDKLLEDESIEWYRQCFPQPRWKDGRRTITGEATPYLAYPFAPQRMAEVLPQARLIALVRNPVDRAYSDYQHVARKGREPLTFEEAIEAEITQTTKQAAKSYRYLIRGKYMEHLLRWSKYFSDEQILVLKSEDLFERTQKALELVLNFLDLPKWEPEASEKRNQGSYEQEIHMSTRQRLEEYFEPHNQRLYEYLGTDLGW
jgi:hypothetical protein